MHERVWQKSLDALFEMNQWRLYRLKKNAIASCQPFLAVFPKNARTSTEPYALCRTAACPSFLEGKLEGWVDIRKQGLRDNLQICPGGFPLELKPKLVALIQPTEVSQP